MHSPFVTTLLWAAWSVLTTAIPQAGPPPQHEHSCGAVNPPTNLLQDFELHAPGRVSLEYDPATDPDLVVNTYFHVIYSSGHEKAELLDLESLVSTDLPILRLPPFLNLNPQAAELIQSLTIPPSSDD